MAKVKVFFIKVGQTLRSRSLGPKFGIHGNDVLSKEMYLCSMKAHSLLVRKP